jgi:hypothetical protein
LAASVNGTRFCGLLRLHVGVKHFGRCFLRPKIWSVHGKAVISHRLSEKTR